MFVTAGGLFGCGHVLALAEEFETAVGVADALRPESHTDAVLCQCCAMCVSSRISCPPFGLKMLDHWSTSAADASRLGATG